MPTTKHEGKTIKIVFGLHQKASKIHRYAQRDSDPAIFMSDSGWKHEKKTFIELSWQNEWLLEPAKDQRLKVQQVSRSSQFVAALIFLHLLL